MLKQTSIFLLILFPALCWGQFKCIDSFENKSLYSSRFKYLTQNIPAPVLGNDLSVFYSAQSQLVKKNAFNNVAWVRDFGITTFARFSTADDGLIGIFSSDSGDPSTGSRGVYKLTTGGNLLWAKKIQVPDVAFNNFGYFANTQKGNNDDILLCNATLNRFSITVLNNDATVVKLARNFSIALPTGENLTGARAEVINNSIYLLMPTHNFQNAPAVDRSNLVILKIDYATGNIVKVAYIYSDDVVSGNHPMYGDFSNQGSFSQSITMKAVNTSHLVIAGRKGLGTFDNNRFYTIKVDTNLNVIYNRIYRSPVSHTYFTAATLTAPSIDSDGNTLFAIMKDSTNFNATSNSCFYFLADSNGNVTRQRHFNIAEAGLNTRAYNLNAVPFLKQKTKAEVILHLIGSEADSLLHIVEIPDAGLEAPCRGNDLSYITTETPGVTQLPSPVITVLPFGAISISPYNLVVQNSFVEERKFCIQKSICDSIKILGEAKFCLPNDTASFKVFKNSQCLRKVIWSMDTTAIRVLSIVGDSVLHVRFLRPYAGYLKAQFENCAVADSIFIEVYKPATSLSVGNDTTLCNNQPLVLHASKGFKQYTWQNGATADSIVVTTAGTYFVTAMDGCDNPFTDSVNVAPAKHLNLTYGQLICQFDTAHVQLNSQFENYTWRPADKATISNGQLHLFPGTSLMYTVSATTRQSCILTDTVGVKVETCPIYFYVPNAFTPNNDGKNDLFKPLIKGPVAKYVFKVYNRYGNLVFFTTNPDNGWDGSLRGNSQDNAVFVWTCTYEFVGKEPVIQKGTVVLMR